MAAASFVPRDRRLLVTALPYRTQDNHFRCHPERRRPLTWGDQIPYSGPDPRVHSLELKGPACTKGTRKSKSYGVRRVERLLRIRGGLVAQPNLRSAPYTKTPCQIGNRGFEPPLEYCPRTHSSSAPTDPVLDVRGARSAFPPGKTKALAATAISSFLSRDARRPALLPGSYAH